MEKTCWKYTETAYRFYEETESGNDSSSYDHENIEQAFRHIYYCFSIYCGLLWQYLDKTAKSSETRKWIERWTDDPDAKSFRLAPGRVAEIYLN